MYLALHVAEARVALDAREILAFRNPKQGLLVNTFDQERIANLDEHNDGDLLLHGSAMANPDS